MKLINQKIVFIALFLGSSFAQARFLEFTTEIICNAQCVDVNVAAQTIDFGTKVKGWSAYSEQEAFLELSRQCPSPKQLVLSAIVSKKTNQSINEHRNSSASYSTGALVAVGQSVSTNELKRHRIKGIQLTQAIVGGVYQNENEVSIESIQIQTEDQYRFELHFANSLNSCRQSSVNPAVGPRYIGGRPIGG